MFRGPYRDTLQESKKQQTILHTPPHTRMIREGSFHVKKF